jgi:alkaline phosphatase D
LAPHRREALQVLGRSALAWALGSLFGPVAAAAPVLRRWPGGAYPFTLGVASGEPAPGSVVLWTRLLPNPRELVPALPPQPIEVHWELAEDARFSRGLRRGVALALPEHAHSVHVEVGGLKPDWRYHYRFIAGGHASEVGRTRTAPQGDAEVQRLRLALASCQHYEHGHYAVHREIARQDVDAVLFVGDYIYEKSNAHWLHRRHLHPLPETLADYRAHHASYKLDADLRAAHAAHPWILNLDDHDVQNDYTGVLPGVRGEPVGGFLQRRARAYKAYFEHLPVSPRRRPQGPHFSIQQHHAWGRLADIWVLDTRQFRSPRACHDPARPDGRPMLTRPPGWEGPPGLPDAPDRLYCDAVAARAHSMLGSVQERWVAAGLARSARRWKLLAQTTQISPSGVDTPWGRVIYSDSWDGYPQARSRLMQAIAEPAVAGVVALGGDVHRSVAARLRLDADDPRSPVVASEFCCSSLTSRGLSEAQSMLVRRGNPDTLHLRSDERGYALLELDARQLTCTFRTTASPVRPDAVLHTQARFVVDARRPGPQPA